MARGTAAALAAPSPSAWVNVRAFGAFGNGVADDTAAFVAALATLALYAGGIGGGTLYVPAGNYRITSTITLPSGVSLVGDGIHSTYIQGAIAGALVQTLNDGGVSVLTAYGGMRDLFLNNTSANAAAAALELSQTNTWHVDRCAFGGIPAGGNVVRARAVYLSTWTNCAFSGVGADYDLFFSNAQSGCNENRLIGCSFRDAKAGVKHLAGTAFEMYGCHFEQLAGGAPVYTGALNLDGVLGGSILGNYFESCPISPIFVAAAVGFSRGFVIGGNFITNCGATSISSAGLTHSRILPNYVYPGANAVNAAGVVASNGTDLIVDTQFIRSGTGAPVTLTGLGMTFSGDYIDMAEIADPAAAGANRGRLYVRDNGAGKSQLVIRFPTGAIQVIATEP